MLSYIQVFLETASSLKGPPSKIGIKAVKIPGDYIGKARFESVSCFLPVLVRWSSLDKWRQDANELFWSPKVFLYVLFSMYLALCFNARSMAS
jgi:hypothetical protein